MPGLVGLITKAPRAWAEATVRGMLQAIHHNSEYETGIWADESAGAFVAWTCLPDAFSTGMPLTNERRGITVIFSGEEFSTPGAAARSSECGSRVASSSLARLSEEGPGCLSRLNGTFHGLLVDDAKNQAVLFNDRYGMHRLYCYEGKDAVYFASEAKAILSVQHELRSIDTQGFAEWLSCGCVLENRTLFSGISLLPPASAWRFEKGALIRKQSYFSPKEWEEAPFEDERSYYQELRAVFSECVERYFSGPQRIGVSLTGGLDSRMILASHKSPPESLPCYSFGGMVRDSQDVTIARELARLLRQKHDVLRVGGDFLRNFGHYAERAVYLTDGCVAVNHAPDLYLNEQAAKIAPVRMTGNYGGEVLRRVRAFRPGELPSDLFCAEINTGMRTAAQTYQLVSRCHPLSFAAFVQAPWHHYGLRALEETQLTLRTPYLDNDLVRTVFRAPESVYPADPICRQLITDGNPALSRVRTDIRPSENSWPLYKAVGGKLLRMSFLAEYAYDYGMPQRIAKFDKALSFLPMDRLLLGWHKFTHYRLWYRDQLSGYVRDILLDGKSLSRPYLCRKTVERVVQGHLSGTRNYTREIHKLLSAELMHRTLIDARSMETVQAGAAVFA